VVVVVGDCSMSNAFCLFSDKARGPLLPRRVFLSLGCICYSINIAHKLLMASNCRADDSPIIRESDDVPTSVFVVIIFRFTAQMVKLHAITFIQQIRFQMKENSNRTLTIFRKDAESHQKDGEEKEKEEEKEEEKEKEKEKEEEKAAGAGNAVTATTHQAKSAPDTPR